MSRRKFVTMMVGVPIGTDMALMGLRRIPHYARVTVSYGTVKASYAVMRMWRESFEDYKFIVVDLPTEIA